MLQTETYAVSIMQIRYKHAELYITRKIAGRIRTHFNSYYISMKKILLAAGAAILLLNGCKKTTDTPAVSKAADTLNYDMNETAVINAGWNKVLEESFSTDLSNWNIWQSGAYNNEYQYYSNHPKNIHLENGILTITAIKETVTGNKEPYSDSQKTFDFTSARIESKTSISANTSTPKIRLSARIKLAPGYGMWPAFWSYGDAWPTNGEIDVMEAKGHLPFQYGTNYFYGATAGKSDVPWTSGVDYTGTKDLTLYWHVYEVIWEETKLTFMLDGKIIRTLTNAASPGNYIDEMFGKDQNIALNLAVGGDYFNNPSPSTIETGSMYVDWVRVFTGN
ncbi:b-glycosidase, glycoside hydrolase family 16 protein [Cytophaga hutchinsonii ATCC 33406]|uniref:B-glycosidase, glycoside hydrolase family 16 protein n=2 Tax=Cytophaga hutchinsonii TaxID=985 RepID=A0A6N4SPN9_CYTH3|nr:b-glycosidase, glycoside hydrolase family 16 protein [Cytophaga hutchinsonii ATCC 33406]